MAFSRFQTDTGNISALSDRPNDADGLTAEQLKARFDKAGDDIKNFLNNTLLAELEETTAAVNIGIDPIPGLNIPGTSNPATNVQEALASLYNFANEAYEKATGNRKSPAFSITGGTYAYKEQAVGTDGNNWELALLSGTNAKITFAKTTGPIDVFLIGGGSAGSVGALEGYTAKGGDGGRSGKRVTRLNMEIEEGVSYSFTVGAPGKVTKIFGIQSPDGTYTEGGAGAEVDMTNYPGVLTPAVTGNDGEYAFDDANCLLFPGRKYGAGGGGGGVSGRRTISYMDSQGNYRQEVIQQNAPGANGGTTGGGYGANAMSHEPGAGTDNTGSGGGGAFFTASDNGNSSGTRGTGGSGIIIIRNARG